MAVRLSFYKGKSVLVTGAANGLGAAVSRKLAETGARLILLDKDQDALHQLCSELQAFENKPTPVVVDISLPEQIDSLLTSHLQDFKCLDILINNAAVSHQGHVSEMNPSDFSWVVNTNLVGTYHCIKFLIPHLQRSEQAMIVNVISGIAFHGLPGFSAYAASKAGLRSLTQSLRYELAESGIQVKGVFPGPIKTLIPTRSRHTTSALREREMSYLQNQGYDPDIVANQLLMKVLGHRNDILLSMEVKTGFWINRLFPGILSWFIRHHRDKLPL